MNRMVNIAESDREGQKKFKGPNRTLRLVVTDGHQTLTAIE